jgi:hypothetical protein
MQRDMHMDIIFTLLHRLMDEKEGWLFYGEILKPAKLSRYEVMGPMSLAFTLYPVGIDGWLLVHIFHQVKLMSLHVTISLMLETLAPIFL